MSTTNTAAPAAAEPQEPQRTAAEIRRENRILRAGQGAGLSSAETDELLRSDLSADAAVVRVLEIMRDRQVGLRAGHPVLRARLDSTQEGEPFDPLADAMRRAMAGLPLEQPLLEVLKAHGYAGRDASELARSAFITGKRSGEWLQRGLHATSDAPSLFVEAGDRRLQERHAQAPRGILELARSRVLSDFREVSVVDAGLVGSAQRTLEGGEVRFGSLNSEAGRYKPSRYELGVSFSFEAMTSDDLGGIQQVLDEVSQTMLTAEAEELSTLLHGPGGLGGTCPDGLPLFHADHANKPTAAASMSVAGLGSMIQLLRSQTSIGGRRLWLDPGYVLVGPDIETTALQLLSTSWDSTTPDDANPWKNLRLIVDPNVPPLHFYLIASGSRKPFELGRVAGMPRMTTEEDFNTSGLRMKVTHAFGAACIDHRVIVRNR